MRVCRALFVVLVFLPLSVISDDQEAPKLLNNTKNLPGCLQQLNAHGILLTASYVKVCYRDDPKVAKCIKKNIETLMPIFKSGAKEFDLQPLDPLRQYNLSFSFNGSFVGGKVDLPYTFVHGLSNIKVLNVRPKLNIPNKFELGFDVNFPLVNSKSAYTLSGNIISIPVDVKGNADAYFEDLNVTYHIVGDVQTIDNYDYLILRSFTWNLRGEGVRNAYLRNDDVVIGKPALNTLAKNIIKSSWRQLKAQMLPAVQHATESWNKNIFFKFFKKFPYDVLFPKRTRTVNVNEQ